MSHKKLDYIDALRGWAVLLVISSHACGAVTGLPYPVRKLSNFGWYGVQLFFLASALTLLLSWHADQRALPVKLREFFIRRVFRIAPLYYVGALLYGWTQPPTGDWDWAHVARTLTFVNAWSPQWLPTTPGGWTVVPGGWSISVEFMFYAMFPLLALMVRQWGAALLFLLLSWGLATALNPWMAPGMTASWGALATSNFLYFWLPNQLPVFALGFVTYFLLSRLSTHQWHTTGTRVAAAAVLLAMLWVSQQPPVRPHYLHAFGTPTPMLLASLLFVPFIVLMSSGQLTWLCQAWIRRLGTLSFSMYMLHIAVIHALSPLIVKALGADAQGLHAIGVYAVLWSAVVLCTALASTWTHRYIEEVGNGWGRRLIHRLRQA